MPAEHTATDELLVGRDGPVATVTLNRPERLNALSHALIVRLRSLLAELDGDERVRVIVLTGAGRAFSSGADLRAGPSDAETVLRDYYNPLIVDMLNLEKPLVAAINGVAAGAAVSLTLACDLRVAAEDASFRLSFVEVGLVPDAGATWLLPRAVGSTRAAEIALLGQPVAASRALSIGLINQVAPPGETLAQARELAHTLARLSSTVGMTRRLLHQGLSTALEDQLHAEVVAQGSAHRGPDFQEAKRAFAEKRRPQFI